MIFFSISTSYSLLNFQPDFFTKKNVIWLNFCVLEVLIVNLIINFSLKITQSSLFPPSLPDDLMRSNLCKYI